jgi:hypothetical protein
VFPGFAVPGSRAFGAPTAGASVPVGPQTVVMQRTAPMGEDGGRWVAGWVAERACLGAYWEYAVRPAEGDLRLRVTAAPTDVYQADEAVWLRIDPSRIASIPPPEGSRA